MLDPRSHAIVIWADDGRSFSEKTSTIRSLRDDGTHTVVIFTSSTKEYRYASRRVVAMRDPQIVTLARGTKLRIDGTVLDGATEVLTFAGPEGPWSRVSFDAPARPPRLYQAKGEIVEDAAAVGQPADVLGYWRELVSARVDDDPLRWSYDRLTFIDPESALARYLGGPPALTAPVSVQVPVPTIFPFSHNASQRRAVETALSSPVSVIDGPPGTGKTQTILNLIASIVAVPGLTVGVVSSNNSAVENIRDKLVRE